MDLDPRSHEPQRAAVRHESAFRQELAIGLPLLALAWWTAPGRWEALAMSAAILLVFVVELLTSAVEAIADAVSVEHARCSGARRTSAARP